MIWADSIEDMKANSFSELTPEEIAIKIIGENEDLDPREVARLIDEAISLDIKRREEYSVNASPSSN